MRTRQRRCRCRGRGRGRGRCRGQGRGQGRHGRHGRHGRRSSEPEREQGARPRTLPRPQRQRPFRPFRPLLIHPTRGVHRPCPWRFDFEDLLSDSIRFGSIRFCASPLSVFDNPFFFFLSAKMTGLTGNLSGLIGGDVRLLVVLFSSFSTRPRSIYLSTSSY